MKRHLAAALAALSILLTPAAFGQPAWAEDSKFRAEFAKSYRENRFTYLDLLIKKNKDIIPGEIGAIVTEAMAPDRSFPERMELLDLAGAMASMYAHHHGDASHQETVEKLVRDEAKKEEARKAELHKWDVYEKFPGNFVLKYQLPEMDKEGLAPVLYPHWIHRLTFECKACHPGIFQMKRGENAITKAKILEGKLCGECHNGKIAFDAKSSCEKCHLAGRPEGERLSDVKSIDHEAIKKAASAVGSQWNPEKLKGSAIPIDKYGAIDWEFLDSTGARKTTTSKDRGVEKKNARDTKILFEGTMPYIKSVVFNHTTHTSRIECAVCHPAIFKEEAGGEKVTMKEMGDGQFCGTCHGKVAFRMADCNRCHSRQHGLAPDGLITRHPK